MRTKRLLSLVMAFFMLFTITAPGFAWALEDDAEPGEVITDVGPQQEDPVEEEPAPDPEPEPEPEPEEPAPTQEEPEEPATEPEEETTKDPVVDYYLVGSMNGWATYDNYKFSVNPNAEGEWMLKNVSLSANAEVKVVSSANVSYPDQQGNKVITDAGVYDFYFKPDGSGTQPDWHYGYFYAAKHTLTAHAATDETCTTAGNSAYWQCNTCGKYFSDADHTTQIAADSWVIPATGNHTLTHTPATAATVDAEGNIEYWTCSVCGKYFSDAAGTTEITQDETVIPAKVAVAKIGETKYETLEAAFTEVADGQTITLLGNVTQDDGLLFNKPGVSAKLDLNKFTITVNTGSNVNNRAIRIDAGTLEVYGGSIVAVGSGTTSSDGAGCYGAFRVEANGVLNAHDLTLRNARPWGLNVKVLGGEATLTNVTITSSYGGGIEVTEAELGNSSKAGKATLTNCTFTQNNYFDHCSTCLSVSGGSELIVNSGTYSSENYVLYVFSSGGVITVNGGTFTSTGTGNNHCDVLKAAIDTSTYPKYTGGLVIKGGSFSGANGKVFAITSPAYASVSGGAFSDPVIEQYCAAGYIPKATTVDNVTTYGVDGPYVAKIGETKYRTLEAAFTAAVDGDTITLLANCSGNGISVPSRFTTEGLIVDFNGYTYTIDGELAGSTGTKSQAFQLLRDSKITFKNGTVYSEKAKMLINNYSDLTLNGMTLTLNNPNYASAYTLSNNNGEIVINNTTINANPAGRYAFDVCRGGGGANTYLSVHVTVTGTSVINGDVEVSASGNDAKDGFSLTLTSGTLNGDIVVDASAKAAMAATPAKAEVTKADAFTQAAPADYEWVSNGDGTSTLVAIEYVAKIGETKYRTLADAIAAAQAGDTITLLADDNVSLTNGQEITLNKSLTIDGNSHTIYGTPNQTGTNDIFITGSGTVTIKNVTVSGFGNNANTDPAHAPIYVSSNFTGKVNLIGVTVKEFNRGGIFLYGGEFLVDECEIDCANSRPNAFTKGIEIKDSAHGTISDTSIYNMERSSTTFSTAGIEIYGSGTVVVDSCIISSNEDTHSTTKGTYGIVSSRVGDHDPSGGSVTITDTIIDTTNAAISVTDSENYGPVNDYSMTVSDSTFTNYIATWSATSSITINSGYFAEDVYADAGTITIHGGNFTKFAPDTGTNGSIVIDGGTFDKAVPAQYCAAGYIPKDNGDDTYGVKSSAYVARVDGQGYETFAEALAAANTNGGTLTLLADVALTTQQNITHSMTIDLNGHSITAADCRALHIQSGEVEITGTGTITSTKTEGSGFDKDSSVIRVGNSGTAKAKLTLGANVTVAAPYSYGVTVFGTNTNGVELVVNGTVTATGLNGAISGNGNSGNKGAVTINDGAVVSSTVDAAIYHPQNDNLTINGGTITGPTAVYVKCGTVEINGGTLTGNGAQTAYSFYGNGCNATGDALVVDNCNYPGGVSSVTISGGTLSSTNGKGIGAYTGNGEDQLAHVTATNPAITLVKGQMWVETTAGSSTYEIGQVVATVSHGDTTTNYPSLQAAVNAAQNGDTVTVVANNLSFASRVDVLVGAGNTITIDLGGNTLYATGTAANGSIFNIITGTVTIKNGTLDGTKVTSKECDPITVRSGATLNLVDGLTIEIDSKNGACVYAFEGGTVNISGGTYKNNTTETYEYNANMKAMVVNQANEATQLITISGGVFYGFDPNKGDDSGKIATFLAAGKATKLVSGHYEVVDGVAKIMRSNSTVYYESLAEAIAAAQDGDTVTLLVDLKNDTALTSRVEVDPGAGKAITIDLNGKTIAVTHITRNGSAFNIKSGTVTLKNGTIDGTGVEEGQTGGVTVENGICLVTVRSGATLNLVEDQDETLRMVVNSQNGCCVYPFADGTVNISGGTYENKTTEPYKHKAGFKGLTVNQANVETQLVHITGGTFIGNDPQLGDDYGARFTEVGYVALESNTPGTFVVQPGWNVTFNTNGGTPAAIDAQRVAAGGKATAPTAPTKEGSVFGGWQLNGAAFDFTTPITADIELTAQWTEANQTPAFKVYGGGLQLEGKIIVQIYTIPMNGSSVDHVTLTINGRERTVDFNHPDETDSTSVSGSSFAVFNCPVYAKEMDAYVVLKAYDSSGNLLQIQKWNGDLVDEYTYSVKTYVDKVTNPADARYPLVQAMSNYGDYAAYFFENRTSNTSLPNGPALTVVDLSSLDNFKANKTEPAGWTGPTYYGGDLLIEEGTYIQVYFNGSVDGCTFTCVELNSTLTPKYDADYGMYYVEISNISAPNINCTYNIQVEKDNMIYTVSYSALSYVRSVLRSASASQTKKDVVTALYWYWYNAEEFFPKA